MRLFKNTYLFLAIGTMIFYHLGSEELSAHIAAEHTGPRLQMTADQYYAQATAERNNHNLLKAQELYREIILNFFEFPQFEMARKELEAVNITIIHEPTATPETLVYVVKKGDVLESIARYYNTTVDLIQLRNHLVDHWIYPGEKLSIWMEKFEIDIDKSDNVLTLISSDRIIKKYPVSTGKQSSTPIGEFTIAQRMVNPVWFHQGVVVPPGTPQNFLGSRWLGFNLPKYGIHGTIEPERIGQSVSSGCVRMRNEDVEELYTMIPLGTKVVIRE